MPEYSPIQNKYYSWYLNIISNAKTRNEGSEKHHIIPKSLGGSNDKQNLVLLTYREHLICHWLLIYSYQNKAKAKMVHALHRMCNRNKNSRLYDIARKLHAEELSKSRRGVNHPLYGKPAYNKVQYIRLNCKNCGKEYEVKPSIVVRSKYCSRECLYKGRDFRGAKNPSYKGGNVTLLCYVCKQQYEVRPSDRNRSKCCSKKCQMTFMRNCRQLLCQSLNCRVIGG